MLNGGTSSSAILNGQVSPHARLSTISMRRAVRVGGILRGGWQGGGFQKGGLGRGRAQACVAP